MTTLCINYAHYTFRNSIVRGRNSAQSAANQRKRNQSVQNQRRAGGKIQKRNKNIARGDVAVKFNNRGPSGWVWPHEVWHQITLTKNSSSNNPLLKNNGPFLDVDAVKSMSSAILWKRRNQQHPWTIDFLNCSKMLRVQQIVRVEADVVAVTDVVVPLVVNVVADKTTDKVAVDNHQTDEDTKFLQSCSFRMHSF